FQTRFDPAQDDIMWADLWLRAQDIGVDDRLVVLHPGTGGPPKPWFPGPWSAVGGGPAGAAARLVFARGARGGAPGGVGGGGGGGEGDWGGGGAGGPGRGGPGGRQRAVAPGGRPGRSDDSPLWAWRRRAVRAVGRPGAAHGHPRRSLV